MTTHASTKDRRRILVVANETTTSGTLDTLIGTHVENAADARVLVVAPILNSRFRHWTSDLGRARVAAARRLQACVGRLEAAGIETEGLLGDSDPLQAIEDALGFFAADRIIVSTHPEGRSNWLAHDLVGRARDRFRLPVTHLIVDLETGRERVLPSFVARRAGSGMSRPYAPLRGLHAGRRAELRTDPDALSAALAPLPTLGEEETPALRDLVPEHATSDRDHRSRLLIRPPPSADRR